MPKYLRQIGSPEIGPGGHIYHWTPALAKRQDMVVYDEETAQIRIEQMKKRLEEIKARKDRQGDVIKENPMQKILNQAKELAGLEIEVERLEVEERVSAEAEALAEAKGNDAQPETLTPEKIAEMDRQKKIDSDTQVIKIRAMTDKDSIESYALAEYGFDIDKRKNLESLKEWAEDLRVERMFETAK